MEEQFSWYKSVTEYADALASGDSTPGGGSAAAVEAALGCALMMMAIKTTLKLKSTPQEVKPALENNLAQLNNSFETIKTFIVEDSRAYKNYLALKKEAKTNPAIVLDDAVKAMATVPVNTALNALAALKYIDSARAGISSIIVSDMFCAEHMLISSLRCCVENMKINLPFVTDESLKELLKQTIEQCEKVFGDTK